MKAFEQLEIGKVGLVRETDDGRIRQIGLTPNQSEMLQSFLAILSNESPLVQMGDDYDLILKKNLER